MVTFQKHENISETWKYLRNIKTFKKYKNISTTWSHFRNMKIFQKHENISETWKHFRNMKILPTWSGQLQFRGLWYRSSQYNEMGRTGRLVCSCPPREFRHRKQTTCWSGLSDDRDSSVDSSNIMSGPLSLDESVERLCSDWVIIISRT